MTEQAVTLSISGIKCDNTECDYFDDTVSRDNYLEYIDKPCPDCGSILLTRADYETVLALEGVAVEVNLIIPNDILDSEGEEVTIEVQTDTKGGVKLLEKKD